MPTHRLSDHFQSPQFMPNGQRVGVAIRPAADGDGVFAILKVERCTDLLQAKWIADKVSADMRVLLWTGPADEVIQRHSYMEAEARGWTAAIGVELADRANAEAFAEVLATYADPGLGRGAR